MDGREEMKVRSVLTVAGSDCSGGAGIQADLKTIGAFGLYGMSVITAITVQNTMGVKKVHTVDSTIVEDQFRAVLEDIMPDAVKIGMIATADNVKALSHVISEYREKMGCFPFTVLDPVLISTSGKNLLEPEAESALTGELCPLVDLITPNLPEAEHLCGSGIRSKEDRVRVAHMLAQRYGCSVLIKGGHGKRADDFLLDQRTGKTFWYPGEKIKNTNTHGTGCTLSSAIACGMAERKPMEQAVGDAKEYVSGAIRAGLDLGKGNGPLNHFYKEMERAWQLT